MGRLRHGGDTGGSHLPAGDRLSGANGGQTHARRGAPLRVDRECEEEFHCSSRINRSLFIGRWPTGFRAMTNEQCSSFTESASLTGPYISKPGLRRRPPILLF